MNKLLTNNGGQPFFLDDINFLDSTIRESFAGLLRGVAKNSDIYLTDLQITKVENAVSWVEGYIVLGGEILPVAQGSINIIQANTPLYWNIQKSYPESGHRVFEDGQERDCYEIRKAVLTTIVTDFPENKIKSISKVIHDLVSDSVEMPLMSEDISKTYSDYSCTGKITYRRRAAKFEELILYTNYDFKLQIVAINSSAVTTAKITTVISSERILCEIPLLEGMFSSTSNYAGTAVFQNTEENAFILYHAIIFADDKKAYVALRDMSGVPLTEFGFGSITVSIDLNRM